MTRPEKKTAARAGDTLSSVAVDVAACVVNTKNCVGRAVNGRVCSYHAMHYDRNGKRR